MYNLNIRGVPISFPFEPYPLQKDYMEKVIECLQNECNGILESPTGTGKTLSLLCSSLAWLQMRKAQMQAENCLRDRENIEEDIFLKSLKENLDVNVGTTQNREFFRLPTIIYSSRTHSQLSQAMQEMKRTAYNNMKAIVIGSRDQLCIHPELLKEENKNNKLVLCLNKMSTRSCHFFNKNTKQATNPEIVNTTVLDIEDLVSLGTKHTFCPYYMSKDLQRKADIIFMPYNYLLDPIARKSVDLNFADNIIIFDEAHNVEGMCENAASFQIKSTDIILCIEEVTEVMKAMSQGPQLFNADDTPKDFSADDLCSLKKMFLDLEKTIDDIEVEGNEGVTFPGDYIFTILEKAGVNDRNRSYITQLIEQIIQFLATVQEGPFARTGNGLRLISDLFSIVFSGSSEEYKQKIKECFKVHLVIEESKNKKTTVDTWLSKPSKSNKTGCRILNYWCFNPGFGMNMLMSQHTKSVILTSGTLAPLKPLISELDINVKVTLENPHVVKGDQVCVKILSRGPDGEILNCNYQNRNNARYIQSTGLTLLSLSKVIPHGLLVFFPSYPVMENFKRQWQEKGIWSSICAHKPIYVEPRDKRTFNTVMSEYYTCIQNPDHKGAIFFAVCRGKVSEGLDFIDNNGRAVLIIGLPYPPMKDPRVVLKKQYLDNRYAQHKEYLKGQEWYGLEATRSVNQAIGRVIRHRSDYGAIILLDSRFSSNYVKKELSLWLQQHIKQPSNFKEIMQDLRAFFKNAEANFPVVNKKTSQVENIGPERSLHSVVGDTSRKMGNFDFSTSQACCSSESLVKIVKRDNSENLVNISKRKKLTIVANKPAPALEDENKNYILMVKKVLNYEDFNAFVTGLTMYRNENNLDNFIKCLDSIFFHKGHLKYIVEGLERFIKTRQRDQFKAFLENIK